MRYREESGFTRFVRWASGIYMSLMIAYWAIVDATDREISDEMIATSMFILFVIALVAVINLIRD